MHTNHGRFQCTMSCSRSFLLSWLAYSTSLYLLECLIATRSCTCWANKTSSLRAKHSGCGLQMLCITVWYVYILHITAIVVYAAGQILFVFSIILFWGDLKESSGLDSGHWVWGTTLYLAVLLTVLGKAALISKYAHARVICSLELTNMSSHSLWTKYTVAGMSLWLAPDVLYINSTFLSDPRFIRLYHAFPPTLRRGRSRHRVLNGIPRHCSQAMDGLCLLLHVNSGPHHLSDSRFRMEIVSNLWPCVNLNLAEEGFSSLATSGRIIRSRITLRRRSRNTTSPTIGHDKNSKSVSLIDRELVSEPPFL